MGFWVEVYLQMVEKRKRFTKNPLKPHDVGGGPGEIQPAKVVTMESPCVPPTIKEFTGIPTPGPKLGDDGLGIPS